MNTQSLTAQNPALAGRLIILEETGSTNTVVKELLRRAKAGRWSSHGRKAGKGRAGRALALVASNLYHFGSAPA